MNPKRGGQKGRKGHGREVQEVMGTVLHTEMGLGTASALEQQQVSEALEVAHDKTCRTC